MYYFIIILRNLRFLLYFKFCISILIRQWLIALISHKIENQRFNVFGPRFYKSEAQSAAHIFEYTYIYIQICMYTSTTNHSLYSISRLLNILSTLPPILKSKIFDKEPNNCARLSTVSCTQSLICPYCKRPEYPLGVHTHSQSVRKAVGRSLDSLAVSYCIIACLL